MGRLESLEDNKSPMIPKQKTFFLIASLLAVLTPTELSHAAVNSPPVQAKSNTTASTPKVQAKTQSGKKPKMQGTKSLSSVPAPKGVRPTAVKAVTKPETKPNGKVGTIKNSKSAKAPLMTKPKALKTTTSASKAGGSPKGAGIKKSAGKVQAKSGAFKPVGAEGKTKGAAKAVSTPGKLTSAKQTKSGTPKKSVTPSSRKPSAERTLEAPGGDTTFEGEDSGGFTPILIGLLMAGLGALGILQYRRKKAAHSQHTGEQFSESNSPHSTFVSQITATELDSTSMIDAPLSKAERPLQSKLTGGPSSIVAKTFKAGAQIAGGTSIPNQKIAASPPRSGAPQQIVQPKKNKPPAAS